MSQLQQMFQRDQGQPQQMPEQMPEQQMPKQLMPEKKNRIVWFWDWLGFRR